MFGAVWADQPALWPVGGWCSDHGRSFRAPVAKLAVLCEVTVVAGDRMHTIANRGGPQDEHADAGAGIAAPDWEAVRALLQVVRFGSFRSAAERLGTSPNALRRKIDELEHTLGTILLTRHVDGVRPTAEGSEILLAAKKMEEASFGLVRARDRAVPAMSGKVRLGVTEAFGTFWLGPRLVEFQRAYPQLGVDLACAMRSADVLRLEADVAIQLTRPTNPDVKIVRLGRIHSMLAAAPSYLAIYGTPKTVDDLRNHRLAMQFADQTKSEELLAGLFPTVPLAQRTRQVQHQQLNGAAVGHHQGRRHRLVADLYSRHGAEDGAARYRRDFPVRYLADLSSGCGACSARAAADRLDR